MRIAFLTNKTARVNMPVYESLIRGGDVVLTHTFFYDTVSAGRGSPLTIIAQFGLGRVAAKACQAVASGLRRQLGKRLGAKWIRAKSPYELAVIQDLPHSTISDMNQPQTINFLQSLNVDVLLVCVCKNILRRKLLSTPNKRFVNIHPSLLPRYRGPTPTFWMLYHGESKTGVTFHLMTPKIDNGKILAQLSLPLDRGKTEFQIEYEVFQLAGTIVNEVLQNLESSQIQAVSQIEDQEASYYTFPTQTQRRELKRKLARMR